MIRCMVKPATNMVGAPAVGIRLQTRFVIAEKIWIFSGLPPLMAKQPFSESLISSMASQSRCSPFGRERPSGPSVASIAVSPRSGDRVMLVGASRFRGKRCV